MALNQRLLTLVDEKTRQALAIIAKQEDRSVAWVVREAISRYLAARGE
jgi:predicted transcriptional regulator